MDELTMQIFVAVYLTSVVVGVIVGARKGEFALALLATAILGPLGLAMVLLSVGNWKQCPHCKAQIKKKAIVCPKCHQEL